eukprot:gene34040-40671_t
MYGAIGRGRGGAAALPGRGRGGAAAPQHHEPEEEEVIDLGGGPPIIAPPPLRGVVPRGFAPMRPAAAKGG